MSCSARTLFIGCCLLYQSSLGEKNEGSALLIGDNNRCFTRDQTVACHQWAIIARMFLPIKPCSTIQINTAQSSYGQVQAVQAAAANGSRYSTVTFIDHCVPSLGWWGALSWSMLEGRSFILHCAAPAKGTHPSPHLLADFLARGRANPPAGPRSVVVVVKRTTP